MENNINIIYDKLNLFIKKYYFNELIKGGIIFFSYMIVIILLFSFSEYFLYLSSNVKISLFSIFFLSFIFFIWKYIFTPLFGLLKLGKHLTYEQASTIIGKNFSNVDDKLLNLLQLNEAKTDEESLLFYSILQKTKELEFVPFQDAVDYKSNIPYLKKASPFILFFLISVLVSPIIFIDGTKRFFDLNTTYIAPAPFNFTLTNNNLNIYEYSDLEINTILDGEYIPDKVFINYGGVRVRMDKNTINNFSFIFKNINKSFSFYFDADGYQSQAFNVIVKNKPSFNSFAIEVDYPKNTFKASEKLINIKNLTIPIGSFVTNIIESKNATYFAVSLNDSIKNNPIISNLISEKYQIKENTTIKYYLFDESSLAKTYIDSLIINYSIIDDYFPEIEVKAIIDSTDLKQYYFNGKISDDYGFSSLQFVVNVFTDTGTFNLKRENFTIPKNANYHDFFHSFNFSKINLNPGSYLSFYFEVFDNDNINGNKSAKSEIFTYNIPSKDELDLKLDNTNDNLTKSLEDLKKEAALLNKEFEKINNDLKLKNSENWEDKEKIKKLIQKQKDLAKNYEQIKKQLDNNMKISNEFNEKSQNLLDKQQELQNLLDQVFDEETKKKFEELEKLLDKLNKDQLSDKLKDIEMNNEEIEKQIDQNIEFFKQMLVEEKMEKVIEKSKELANKQKELNDKQEKGQINKKEALEEQKNIDKDFDKLKEEMNKLEELNEDLANKLPIPDKKDDLNDIEKELDKSIDDLEKDKGDDNKPSKPKDSQKKAKEKMEEFAESLQNDLNAMMKESYEEDLDDMRQILQNLLVISFDQEETMLAFKNLDINDPKYVKLNQRQKKILDDFKIIEDSIVALSKRVPVLQNSVTKEIMGVKYNHEKAVSFLANRQTAYALNSQQYALTSINNLALMFNEIVEQMQQQMQQQKQGNGSCSKPGANSKPKPGDSKEKMQKMQKKLAEQIEKMKEQMKKDGGNKPDGKEGSKPGGNKSMSESLSKMAAEQEYIRKQLQGLSEELSKSDKQVSQEMKKMMEDLEKVQKDMYNKNLTIETIKRQQDILTRLLEAEKSVRERELDQQRKATENTTNYNRNVEDFKDYFKQINKDTELLNKVPFTLSPYYKQISGYYFNNLD
jgi:hypothetical protein